MLQLYYWPTPNGHKITIYLKESELPFELLPVDIGKGEQFAPAFLRIAPNNRIPALVDTAPISGKEPLCLFESGAILEYLADRTGRFLAKVGSAERYQTMQWLFWQMAGLGPMAGQNHHFSGYAPEKIPYAITRYQNETARLYKVLDHQLSQHAYVSGGDYTIADMAIYPWIVPHERQNQDLNHFPHLKRWFSLIAARPAVQAAYALGNTIHQPAEMTAEAKRILFGTPPPTAPAKGPQEPM